MSMIGKTLGNFEITTELGRGGMGEVYQAKDRKLGRDVAIKVLPEEFAKDADRVARFQREAKLLASLNHPNIAAIYGLEEFSGTNFLVLELVEGETLAEQLKRGPIPVDESLKLALQIAEALEAAHEKGVIHRDLKPANLKCTPEGKVKVLDFGLAKAFAGEQADVNSSNSPTLSNAATQQGVILGTAAYMSPEQARGEIVDKRADIWAFGCVLFEMLTGRGTFEGRTVSDVLASVLKSEPDWNRLPLNLHARIRLLLERCLEKEAKNRCHDIADVRVDIQKVQADPSGGLVQPVTAMEPRTRLRQILPWAAITLILIILAGVAVWNLRKPEPRQVMRFDYELPEGQQINGGLAVSPDGKQFVYSTPQGLYLRSIDELTAKLLPGTEGENRESFFSPDGKWILYFSVTDHRLKKIAINGGAPVALCDVGLLQGATWNEDNTIVYGQVPGDIMRISANGGTPESLIKMKSGVFLGYPQILPGGKSVLYTSIDLRSIESKIMVQSLKSGETKELFAGFAARYLPTGHIGYVSSNGSVFAIPFDLERLEVKGGGVPVLEGFSSIAISDSGTLIYTPRSSAGFAKQNLVWVNRQGKPEPLSAAPNQYWSFRISPDGKRVALMVTSKFTTGNIWIWDIARETMTRLTFDENTNDTIPLWTPDGKRIVYHLPRKNEPGSDIYWKASDGTGEAEKLAASSPNGGLTPWSWSKDGKTLVIIEGTSSPPQLNIGMMSMEGDHTRKPLLQVKHNETAVRISPDGRWMAYESRESGKQEVYVRPFPDVDKGKWQVSNGGGNSPLWSPDGRELFYHSGDAAMAVPVETEPTFKPGKPTVLFRGTYYQTSIVNDTGRSETTFWDISPDGKRFLMLKEVTATGKPAEAPKKINIVVNVFEELKQRVPTGK
jgi:eukaryotic-like serine/threonine-protein kinase